MCDFCSCIVCGVPTNGYNLCSEHYRVMYKTLVEKGGYDESEDAVVVGVGVRRVSGDGFRAGCCGFTPDIHVDEAVGGSGRDGHRLSPGLVSS